MIFPVSIDIMLWQSYDASMEITLLLIYGIIVLVAMAIFLYGTKLFFDWAAKITAINNKEGAPNSILGYNIAFDFLAWAVTALIITISFVIYLTTESKELAVLIMGISIGSVLTRTPSFKEKDR